MVLVAVFSFQELKFVNYCIALFTVLPLKGVIYKKNLSINLQFIHEKKAELWNNGCSFQLLEKFTCCMVCSLFFLYSYSSLS